MRHLLLLALPIVLLCGCPKSGSKTGKKTGIDATANTAVSAGARAKMRSTMQGIQKACISFNAKQGKWPEDMEELVGSKIWSASDRADPWGNDWIIEVDGGTVTVKTLGADGEEGGEGRDADFSVP